MSNSIPCNSLKFPTGQNRLNDNCLSEKQSVAIEMIAMGKSYQFVADALAIDRKTLYLWRQDEDFKDALSERRREMWSSATDRLRGMLEKSLDVIEQQLDDRFDRSRFRAASTVLRVAGLNKCMPQRNESDDE